MKKMLIAAALVAAFASSANAVEIGVNASRDWTDKNGNFNGGGVTIGQKFGAAGIELGYDRYNKKATDLNRYTALGTFDVAKFGSVTLTAKAGVAYLDPTATSYKNGYQAVAGAGVTFPIEGVKGLAATADYRYGYRLEDNVKNFDGSTVALGMKYSF